MREPRSLLVWLSVCLLPLWLATLDVGPHVLVSGLPSAKCRVCEDAMQTWHDHFRCAGGFLNWGDPLSPDIDGCEGPKFDCKRLVGRIKHTCLEMEKQFSTEPFIMRKIWEELMLYNKPYRTCVSLGKCPKDPDVVIPTLCHQAFLDENCMYDPACKNFTTACQEECYVCNWLLRDWPVFQEICKPGGAELPQSVPLPWDIPPGSFLELEEQRFPAAARMKQSVRPSRVRQNPGRHLQYQSALLPPRPAAVPAPDIARALQRSPRRRGFGGGGGPGFLEEQQRAWRRDLQDDPMAEDSEYAGAGAGAGPSQGLLSEQEAAQQRWNGNADAGAGAGAASIDDEGADPGTGSADPADEMRFQQRAQARQQASAAAAASSEATAGAGVGFGELGQTAMDVPKTALQTGFTLQEDCFNMWNQIKMNMKARYFAGWKRFVGVLNTPMDRLAHNMWDANVACKCLGHCELNRFEDLGLLNVCQYDEVDQTSMDYVFKYEGNINQRNNGENGAPQPGGAAGAGDSGSMPPPSKLLLL